MSSLFVGETSVVRPHVAPCTPTHPRIQLKSKMASLILQVTRFIVKSSPGWVFLSLSLISVQRRASYPVLLEQLDQPPTVGGQQESQPKPQGKGEPGRRQGSKNRNRRDIELSPYLQLVQQNLKRLLDLTSPHIKLRHFVFDGAFGHNDAMQMVRQVGLPLDF